MLPETEHTRSSTKSSSPKEEILDVNIPIIKFPRKISKTFPKISPSRKIQNINLVLPPGPKIEFPEDFEDMCNDDYNGDDNRETFVLKERPFNVERTTKIEDLRNIDVIIDKRRENRQTNVSFQASQAVTTPLNTPDVEPKLFKYHAKSTPKFSQASKVMTTPLNAPDVKLKFFKLRANSTPKFSQASEVVTTPLNAPDVKPKFFKLRANSTPKFSQAQLFSSAMIENNQKEKIISPSILEKSLIFENKSMNVSNKSGNIRRSKKISPNLLEKTFIFEKSSTHNSFQESSNSTNLELPLRSKQVNPKKNMVREIVRNLDEKERKSLQHRHSQDDKKKCFVKQIVNALEKRNISRMRSLPPRSSINDEDSPSESETKSYFTSNSPKDTDYSDYGRRSPTLSSDDDQTFNSEYFKEDTLKVKEKGTGDDSVYWISIPRCTVPRSSSLLSVVSKLSSHGHSPCISPIKSPNEIEYSIQTSWGATYKTSNPLCKKLFHETVVIDSGYSD